MGRSLLILITRFVVKYCPRDFTINYLGSGIGLSYKELRRLRQLCQPGPLLIALAITFSERYKIDIQGEVQWD